MNTPNTQPWLKTRTSGVLLHPTSLPGDYGIGNMGTIAHKFIDLIADAGFTNWQMCPLGPTGYGDSPYQSFSSAAGNPYLIDLTLFENRGWLTRIETECLRGLPSHRVDFGTLYETFWPLMTLAKERFDHDPQSHEERRSFGIFKSENTHWLRPFCLFMALKDLHFGMPWYSWDLPWRSWHALSRQAIPEAMEHAADVHAFLQFHFFQQWAALRTHARDRGVSLIGDIPIFVAYDSADCWQDPDLFTLDDKGIILHGAGVPPDYFSATGQRWGNPLYRWELHQSTGFQWWINRLHRTFDLYDIVRIDHFRGFDSYWCIDGLAENAVQGVWLRAPGHAFFQTIRECLPNARFIAEDLGYITADVVKLREHTGLPGMKVLQFAFGHDTQNANLPHRFPSNSVVYTGTHDNDTTLGWLQSLEDPYLQSVIDYFGLESLDSAWPIIRAAFASPSNLAVIPMQDLLNLPTTSRMNIPGTPSGNWQWRITWKQLLGLREESLSTLQRWHHIFEREGRTLVTDSLCPDSEELPSHTDPAS